MENFDKVAVSFFAAIAVLSMVFVAVWIKSVDDLNDIKPQLDDKKIFGMFRLLYGETIAHPTQENFISDNLLLVKTTLGRTVLMPNPGTSYKNGEHVGIVLDEGVSEKIKKYFSKDSTEPVFTNNEVNK